MSLIYRAPTMAAAGLLAQAVAAMIRPVSLCVRRLCKPLQHRRDIAVLAEQDDRLLADMGLTRDDLRAAMGQPLWRDPTAVLARRADAARIEDEASSSPR